MSIFLCIKILETKITTFYLIRVILFGEKTLKSQFSEKQVTTDEKVLTSAKFKQWTCTIGHI